MALAVLSALTTAADELRNAGWRAEITGEGALTVAPSADAEHDFQYGLRGFFLRQLRKRSPTDVRVSNNLQVSLPDDAQRIPDALCRY